MKRMVISVVVQANSIFDGMLFGGCSVVPLGEE
jgi:hypothetical protein